MLKRVCLRWLVWTIGSLTVLSRLVYPAAGNKILVLYKERDPDHQGIVWFLTEFLKTAGYEFDTRDVEQLLAAKSDMSPYLGIMTCFQTSQMVGGDIYPYWLVQQMEAGRRILIIGSYGAYQGLIPKPDGTLVEWNESTQTINTFFYPFGLEFYFAFTSDPKKLRLNYADQEYAQYQSPITPKDLTYFQLFKSVNPANRILLEIERTDMADARSALNVMTPFGAMIIEGYAWYWHPQLKKNILRVNFVKLMCAVFAGTSPAVPKMPLTTHAELLQQYPLPQRPQPSTTWQLKPQELPRRILIPYKKSEALRLPELPLYQRAGLVLEYLGCIPIYRAIEDGLPDDAEMRAFRGIVTWHTKPQLARARQYGEWLLRQIKNGKRVVILQDYGASTDQITQQPAPNQAEVFQALGIRFTPRPEPRAVDLPKLRVLDRAYFDFERPFDPTEITYQHTYTSIDPRNQVILAFADPEFGNVDLGIITPNGGVCLEEAAFYFPAYDIDRIQRIRQSLRGEIAPEIAEQPTTGAWYLNPYRFFSDALNLDELPAPDVTTLNGARIFYAHIDGDALESVSLIDGAHQAGYFVLEEILKKNANSPTTASVISKFIEREGNQYYRPTASLAREIYALPNVEVAVHSATHPFDWIEGDPYITNPGQYPYQVGYQPAQLLEEIWGAKLFVEHNLAPADKKCQLMLWTGATNPGAQALEICWRAGMHNLNGGDPRYDADYPSLASVCPYSLPYPPYRQYLTSAQNDYIYTLFLTGDWGGQKKVLDHFAKTDKPYRFYPMNLYYHFYGGIKRESLEALQFIYDFIRDATAAPIFTSEYCRIVTDFYQTRVGFDGQGYWVENNGDLCTVRFKRPVEIDLERSRGVIGYLHSENQTYVHLDGSTLRRIALTDQPPKIPYIIQATQFIDRTQTDGVQLQFIYRGFGKTWLKFGGLQRNSPYRLTLQTTGRATIEVVLQTDAAGILEYRTQLDAPVAIYQGTLSRGGTR